MPCVTDLSQASASSVPSTLLKKAKGRHQVPFHDRILPSMVSKSQQRHDTDDEDGDGELSPVSTQSLSRSQPSRAHSTRGPTFTKVKREVLLDGSRDQPIVAIDHLLDNKSKNSNHQRPRRPSPERTMSIPNTPTRLSPPTPTTSTNSIAPSKTTTASKSRSFKDGFDDKFDGILNSQRQASPIDFTDSVLQHPSMKVLSSSARDIPNSTPNAMTKQYNHHDTVQQNATDVSEVLGRTIPVSSSSVNVFCSNDDDDDDDDDRHRYILTVTTSRSTIKASGGRKNNGYPRMDEYGALSSPLRPMKSYSFSNYSTQLEDDEGTEDNDATITTDMLDTIHQLEKSDVLHDSNHAYDQILPSDDYLSSAKLQTERENDIISAASSRRSGKLSTIVSETTRDNTSSDPSTETYGRNENNVIVTRAKLSNAGSPYHRQSSSSLASQTSSYNRHNSLFNGNEVAGESFHVIEQLAKRDSDLNNASKHDTKDEASQSKTLSSTRFISNDDYDDDVVEAQRENEILSAAASRKTDKTGRTGLRSHTSSSNRSREVLIEEHENPTEIKKEPNSAAWRKIDDVLFGDDQSELHLFKKPTKDVAFDDLLTTTSDCSSISVSLDPSGCIVNESSGAPSKRSNQVTHVITDVEFNRVKSVLDRMRKPMMVHTNTANAGMTTTRGGGPMAALNAPKMKNRVGTGNFVQTRFKNTPQVSIVRAAKQLEESRNITATRLKTNQAQIVPDVPIVVQARSFHGDLTDQTIIESVSILDEPQQRDYIAKSVEHPQSSSNRRDPPANTMRS